MVVARKSFVAVAVVCFKAVIVLLVHQSDVVVASKSFVAVAVVCFKAVIVLLVH